MSEVYRKFGRTVRYENGTTIRVDEAGEAIEDARTFTCRPIARSVELPEIDQKPLDETVREIRSIVRQPLAIERLIVSDGVAEHQFEGRRWRDSIRRLHVAITFQKLRALIDLGDFELDDVRLVAGAFLRAEPRVHTATRIRTAPSVSAALLPALLHLAPNNIQLIQSAGGVDGKGLPIETSMEPWPNWYRPSYRVRPVRAPFSLRATCDVKDTGEDLPRAIALLAPVERLTLEVLCVHAGVVFPATVRVARIDAVSDLARWYPYGAGSFGAEMML